MNFIKTVLFVNLLAVTAFASVYYNDNIKTEEVYICEIDNHTKFISSIEFNAIKALDSKFDCGKPASVNKSTLNTLKALSFIDNN